MICAYELTNPYQAPDVLDYFRAPDELTVRELLERMNPGFVEFEFPTICLVNSVAWMREDWDKKLPAGSMVAFVRLAGTWEWIIVYAVIAVVSIVLALVLTPSATAPNNDLQNGESVYTLSGQRNQIRLNDPIESSYGRNRIFPAYAARPYNTYRGNQQFQYSLYCLGHGHQLIEQLRFEDTPIEQFDDVEFEICFPGEPLTLFSDNVDTSSAVNSIEMFGPNEKEYVGWSGPFVTNDIGTLSNRIEVDVVLPAGLYITDEDDGKLEPMAVEVAFQYREVGTTEWIPLVFTEKRIVKTPAGQIFGRYFSKTVYEYIDVPAFYKRMATRTPQRFTLGKDVPLGRYEIRAARVNNKNKEAGAANVVKWEALRAFFPSVRDYGAVTLVAIAARATNNLNNNAAQKFNAISTRMLPTWDGTWKEIEPTRNPVWAFCDIFLAKYGGRLPTYFLDLEELREHANFFDENKIYFDHIFDQKSTVWEAAKVVARVGRSIPMLSGSQITMVRDEPKNVATSVFSMDNIIQGTFTWNIVLVPVEDYNGVEIQYVDEETWTEETILCLIDDDEGSNPQTIRFPGCTDRRRAFDEGLYIRACQKKIRENIEFDTGMEGLLARYGDLVLVNHDVPRWGKAGLVEEINGPIITLSIDVEFTPGVEHRLVLRKKDGSAYGPYIVTPGIDSRHVVLDRSPDPEDYIFDIYHEPPYFFFGVANNVGKQCIVVGITPKSEDVVSVKCAAYVPQVFSYVDIPLPEKGSIPRAVTNPDRPVVRSVTVSVIPGTQEFVLVSWPPALGAQTYTLEQSDDGINWTRVETLPSTVAELRVIPSQLYVRVAGVNVDYGPWAYWSGRVGDISTIPGPVLNLRLLGHGDGTVTVEWDAVTGADRYVVDIYETGTSRFLRQFEVTGTQATYTYDQGREDLLIGTDITFNLRGMNILGMSEDPAILATYVLAPADPTIGLGTPTADNAYYTADNSTLTTDKV